jgi:hypothetical protein
MFNILNHKGNANQNYIEIQSHQVRMAIIKKQKQQMLMSMQGKKELLFTAGKNVN